MAKEFSARLTKKERKVIDASAEIKKDVFRISDEKLLQGARLQDVLLKDITVREQVRTKFNDDSLKELSENIRVNGLIQPLVLHRENNRYVLICGERRFRAMSLIAMEKAPCFILENKTSEELMAIQFSENSSREDLHYIDKADGIYNYQAASGASERKIQAALGISKSEVHRSLNIAKLPAEIKEAAKKFDIEKYVLLEYEELSSGEPKEGLKQEILAGKLTKRTEFKKALNKVGGSALTRGAGKRKVTNKQKSLDSEMENIKRAMKDAKTRELLRSLIGEIST